MPETSDENIFRLANGDILPLSEATSRALQCWGSQNIDIEITFRWTYEDDIELGPDAFLRSPVLFNGSAIHSHLSPSFANTSVHTICPELKTPSADLEVEV